MKTLKESILSSNNAGSSKLYFWTIAKKKGASIVSTASVYDLKDPTKIFDKDKIDEKLRKLNKTFRTNILYRFNKYSDSENKILVKLLCLLLPCDSEKEIMDVVDHVISDELKIVRCNIHYPSAGQTEPTLSITITAGHGGVCTLRFSFREENLYDSDKFKFKKISF